MAVTFAADGAVGTITLDNPPANSYDIEFMRELADAVDAASGRRRACASWSCAARARSSSPPGADVKRFLANDVDANMEMIRARRTRRSRASRASPKVFVAQIAGHALGGGLEIALACDLRYAAEGALPARHAGGHARPAARQRRHAAPAADHRARRGAGPAAHRARRSRPTRRCGSGSSAGCSTTRRRSQAHVASARGRAAAGDRDDQARGLRGRSSVPLDDGPGARARARSRSCSARRTRNEGLTAFSEKRAPEFVGA